MTMQQQIFVQVIQKYKIIQKSKPNTVISSKFFFKDKAIIKFPLKFFLLIRKNKNKIKERRTFLFLFLNLIKEQNSNKLKNINFNLYFPKIKQIGKNKLFLGYSAHLGIKNIQLLRKKTTQRLFIKNSNALLSEYLIYNCFSRKNKEITVLSS